jgi:hypothetical protein
MVTETVPGGVTDVEARLQAEAVAELDTLQLVVTGEENPAMGVSVAVVVTELPAMTCPDVGLMASVKSTPLPLKVAFSPLYSKLVEFTPSVPFC